MNINLLKFIHDKIPINIFYIIIFIVSFFYSIIKIHKTYENYRLIYRITNDFYISIKGAIFTYANSLLVISIGSKIINKAFLNKHLIIEGDLKKEGLYVSKHVGTSGFLYKIFALLGKKLLYVRDGSHKNKDLDQYKDLYTNEYIFKKPTDAIKLTRELYKNKSVYISIDGKINSTVIPLVNDVNITFSDVFLKLAYKKNVPIYNLSTSITLSGKIFIKAEQFTYDNKVESLDTFISRYKEFYLSDYIAFTRKYPYALRLSRLKISKENDDS